MANPADIPDILTIDPREHKKDFYFIGCLAVWGLLILGFTAVSIFAKLWAIAAFGALLFLPVLIWAMVQWNKTDALQVTSGGIALIRNDRINSAVHLGRSNPVELTLEHVKTSGDPDTESILTLNIWDNECGFRRRHILGQWIAVDAKNDIFNHVLQFLEFHGFEVQARNETALEQDPSLVTQSG